MDYTLSIIGPYMNETRDFYPVITGGTATAQCTSDKYVMPIADIDIAYVIKSRHPTTRQINAAIKARNKFLDDIRAHLTQNHGSKYVYETKDFAKDNPDWSVAKVFLSRLYTIDKVTYEKRTILDTSVQSVKSNRIFFLYEKFKDNTANIKNKSDNIPIPFIKARDGKIFATCPYVLYDTVRLLLFYKSRLEKPLIINKFKRYLLKYLLLSRDIASKNVEKLEEDPSVLANYMDQLVQHNSHFRDMVKRILEVIPNIDQPAIRDT